MTTNMADIVSIIQGIVIGGIAVVATLLKNHYDVKSKDRELSLKATELTNKTKEFEVKLEFEREKYENELARKRIEIRMDLESKYDTSLRDLRLNAYKNLWLKLYALRLHSRCDKIEYSEIRNLLRDLTKWYYDDGGGMFLSSRSRELYTDSLLNKLQEIADHQKSDNEVVEDKAKVSDILDAGSDFRSSLVDDVGTRAQLKTFFEGKQS